jgi:SpoIIAA-like
VRRALPEVTPVIETLTDLPDGVIGFEAVGHVEAEDYRNVLLPAAEKAAKGGDIRLVYVLGPRFEGYSSGAGFMDAKLGIEHFTKWKRVAVVTDHDWMSHVVGVVSWMIPGEFKAFPLDKRADAIAWAAG